MSSRFISYGAAARTAWAILWRISLPGAILLPFFSLKTPAYLTLIAMSLLLVESGFVLRYLLARKVGRVRLRLVSAYTLAISTDQEVYPSVTRMARLCFALAWRLSVFQLPVILLLWPIFIPGLCLAVLLVPLPLWFNLCDASHGTFLDSLKLLNVEMHELPVWLALQLTWIPVLRCVIGRRLGSFSLFVEEHS